MTKGPYGIPQNVQRTVIALLTADTADLRELARIAGRDPAIFYRGANLRSCDLSQANLMGIDLSGSDKSRARMPTDSTSRVDNRFDKEAEVEEVINEFWKRLPVEEAENLELAYITDLIAMGNGKSLNKATERFLPLISKSKSAALPKFRSVWAKLTLAPLSPSSISSVAQGTYQELSGSRILSRMKLSKDLENILSTLQSKAVTRKTPPNRDLITLTLSRAADVSDQSEVLLEIADLFSRYDHSERTTWKKAIASAIDYSQVASVVIRMQNLSVPIDIRIWDYLLESSGSFEIAHRHMLEMISSGVKPDLQSWLTLFNFAKDYTLGRSIIKEMTSLGFQPVRVFWNILLDLAPDYKKGRLTLEEMGSFGIRPDIDSWNSLLDLTKDYRTGCSVIEDMSALGIRPNSKSYSTLLSVTTDYSTGRAVLREAINSGVTKGIKNWNMLIEGAPSYFIARAVLDEMILEKVKLNESTEIALAKHVSSVGQATELTRLLAVFRGNKQVWAGRYFATIFAQIAQNMSADQLLEWASSMETALRFRIPVSSYGSALNFFLRSGRIDGALKIALLFPHIGPVRAFLLDPKVQPKAERFFMDQYDRGGERHNTTNALAHFYSITGEAVKLRKWATEAKSYTNQHPRRIEALEKLLLTSESRSPKR